MMKWKNSLAYVQKKMNDLFQKYSFVKIYINDVIVFSSSLEKHLRHFEKNIRFFEKWNITLKTSKTYLEYFSISLLDQKVDNFELTTTMKKLKTITNLSFFKTLKDLKIYFDIIEYLRNYVSYYAQKSESLNKHKTGLFKNEPMQKNAKKNFNKKRWWNIRIKKNWMFMNSWKLFSINLID